MAMRYNYKTLIYIGLFTCCFVFTIAGCKKADQFYDTLQNTPQLNLEGQYRYKTDYIVGDTMTLYGRLNPEKQLQITIGNAVAQIVGTQKVKYNSVGGAINDMDKVELLITANMGIGVNRTVAITSGGVSINGPVIEIAAAGSFTIPDTLKLVDYFTPPAGSIFLNCRSGNGNIYYYSAGKIIRLKKGGTAGEVMNAASLSDNQGAFKIVTFNSGGIDPQEKSIFFSALTSDNTTENADHYIFRLCQYDLATHTLLTLNRSVLPKTNTAVIVSDVLPFEGNISDVRLQSIQKLVPDSQGGMYMVLYTQGQTIEYPYAISYLNPNKVLKFIFSNFFDQVSPGYYEMGKYIAPAVPGITMTQNGGFQFLQFNAEEKILYACYNDPIANTGGIKAFDLEARSLIRNVNPTATQTPQFTGLFTSLSLNIKWGVNAETDWPYPMPGRKLLMLTSGLYGGLKSLLAFDFSHNRSDYYTPGQVQNSANGDPYQSFRDEVLNMDESGMLYGTFNQGAKIVKTEPK